ncbi:hypothetical protein [Paenibacillus sp. MZ04-78.2]|nr:hypothetical protein [Paenibacillus sp. MZ04-78.2]
MHTDAASMPGETCLLCGIAPGLTNDPYEICSSGGQKMGSS